MNKVYSNKLQSSKSETVLCVLYTDHFSFLCNFCIFWNRKLLYILGLWASPTEPQGKKEAVNAIIKIYHEYYHYWVQERSDRSSTVRTTRIAKQDFKAQYWLYFIAQFIAVVPKMSSAAKEKMVSEASEWKNVLGTIKNVAWKAKRSLGSKEKPRNQFFFLIFYP